MKRGTKTYVGPSEIHGNGLFAGEDISKEDGFFGTTHMDNWPTEDLGKNYNHSDTPNAMVHKIGNRHLIVPIDKIRSGEEITVDYRNQPELEQPQEGWKCGGKIKGYQDGGGIKPKISFTKEQLDEYASAYEGEGTFMDQVMSEYQDMGYFPVMGEDGTLSAYEVADISEGIMQHGYRGKKLAEMLGTDRAVIDEKFQPVYDYHAAQYDARGKRKIQEYMDMGFTKQGAFNELLKKGFGTQEGLERVFGTHADQIATNKLRAQRAARDLMQRQKEQGTGEETYTAPAPPLLTRHTPLTVEQLRSKALEGGPTVEGAKLLEQANELERQNLLSQNFEAQFDTTPPEIAESTGMSTSYLGDTQITMDPQALMTPTERMDLQRNQAMQMIEQARREYSMNPALWRDQLGVNLDDFVNEETGDYDYVALAQKMYSPEMREKKLANFKAQEQKTWDEMPWYAKAGQGLTAFLDDPILTGSQWMSGTGPMVGQQEWLSDPAKAQELASQFGITTDDLYEMSGDSESWINDVVKYINPLHYASQAGVNLSDASKAFEAGEWGEGFSEMGDASLDFIGAFLGAKAPTSIPGAATAEQLGIKQVLKRQAKPSELFKRRDLVRVTSDDALEALQKEIKLGKIDPSDAMWHQRLRNNPELVKYIEQYGDEALIKNVPLTGAAASKYRLDNLIKGMKKGDYVEGVSQQAIEDAATKSIPSKAQMMSDAAFKQQYLSLPLHQRINVNQLVSQPHDYWKNPLLYEGEKVVNPALKEAIGSKLYSPTEYLFPRSTTGFKPLGAEGLEGVGGPLINRSLIETEKKVAGELSKDLAQHEATITAARGEEDVEIEEEKPPVVKGGLFNFMNTGPGTGRRKYKWIR